MATLTRRTACALVAASLSGLSTTVTAGSWSWDNDGTRKALEELLKPFFGNAKGRYIGLAEDFYDTKNPESQYLLYNQFAFIFQVPDDEVQLPGGFRLLPAWQAHNATVRAFVVTLGNSNQIVAAGLLHNFCGESENGCEDDHTLSIFYSGKTTSNPQINAELIKFYSDYLKDLYKNRPERKGVKMKIQVRQL